jgi:hypothetical protein
MSAHTMVVDLPVLNTWAVRFKLPDAGPTKQNCAERKGGKFSMLRCVASKHKDADSPPYVVRPCNQSGGKTMLWPSGFF